MDDYDDYVTDTVWFFLWLIIFGVIALCAAVLIGKVAPGANEPVSYVAPQQSYVANEIEGYLLSSPAALLNDLMTGPVASADCDDWPDPIEGMEEMQCWFDNYQGERAFALFDVSDTVNWELIQVWR